jgi:hypothetical protein
LCQAENEARAALAKGIRINRVAKAVGLGVGTVAKLKHEMVTNAQAYRTSETAVPR